MRVALLLVAAVCAACVWGQQHVRSHGIGFIGSDTAYGAAMDSMGNSYSCGHFDGTIDLQPGAATHNVTGFLAGYVVKYDSTGDVSWSAVLAPVSPGDMCIPEMPVVDSVGNVYLAGRFRGSVDFDPGSGTAIRQSLTTTSAPATENAFLLKLDASGALAWVHTFRGDWTWGTRVSVHGNRVAITGLYNGLMDLDPTTSSLTASTGGLNTFVVVFDDAGNLEWGEAFSGALLDLSSPPMLDAGGLTIVTSYLIDLRLGRSPTAPTLFTTGNADGLIVRFTPGGTLDWFRVIAGPGANVVPTWAQSDAAGNIYICGNLRETADFDPGTGSTTLTASPGSLDGWIARYSPSGDLHWVRGLHGPDDVTMVPLAAHAGGVYAAGNLVGSVDLDPGPGTALHQIAGGCAFIVALDDNGDYQWSVNFGDTAGTTTPYGMATDGAGTLLTCGPFDAAGDFDPGPQSAILTPVGGRDGWLLWLADGAHVPPLEITTSALPDATTGVSVNQDITAQGGSGSSYQWSLDSGVLPPGIGGLPAAATPTLMLTGVPTQAGTFPFRLRVEDDAANVAFRDFSWVVVDPPLPPLVIQTLSLPDGTVGSPISTGITASGGTDSGYQWSLELGALPPGTTGLPGAGTPAVALSGTPTAAGTFGFRVRVTDDAANSTAQDFSWIIHPAPTPPLIILTTSLQAGVAGEALQRQLEAQGGSGSGYAWTLETGVLPDGVAGLPGSGTPAITLSGIPASSGVFSFRVRVEDDAGNSANQDLTWSIAAAPPPTHDSGGGGGGGCAALASPATHWLFVLLVLWLLRRAPCWRRRTGWGIRN